MNNIYKWQSSEYLEGLRDRIIETWTVDGYTMKVVEEINEILENRKNKKEILPCWWTCWGACGLLCKNL